MKKKKLLKLDSVPAVMLISVMLGVIASTLCLILLSVILVNYDISHSVIKYFWIPVALTGGILTGLFCGKNVKSKGIIWGSAAAFAVSLIILLILLIFNGFSVSLFTLLPVPDYVLSGAVGGVISSNLR